jgi:Flp pilus assembly secretin CpaC
MKWLISRRIALAVAVVAAGTIGASPLTAQTRVISSDEQSRFMALGVSKSVVVEVSRDIKDIVVADRTIATVVALTKRRVEIIGAGLGQTNVFLFDNNGRQIDGFDVAVKYYTQQHGLADYPDPSNVVTIVNGGPIFTYNLVSCTPISCLDARKPGADQPPGTENINIMGNTPTGVNVGAGAGR